MSLTNGKFVALTTLKLVFKVLILKNKIFLCLVEKLFVLNSFIFIRLPIKI